MNIHIHSAELEAVSISLVMGSKVVVVENTDAENGRINARTQEEDCDEARHLVDKVLIYNLDTLPVNLMTALDIHIKLFLYYW